MTTEAEDTVLIDDESLTDRGDTITPPTEAEKGDKADKADKTARDEKGRFVKKDEEGEAAEEAEEGEAAEEAEEGEAAEEGEEAEEGEAAEEGEEAEEDDGKAVDKNSPAYRIRKLVEDRNRLREELAAAKAAAKTTEKAEDQYEAQRKAFHEKLDGLYEKVEEARADGDTKLAAKLQREIDGMNSALAKAESVAAAQQRVEAVQQNKAYDKMLDYLEQVRPIMNPNSEEFDAEFIKQLQFQVTAHERAGMPPTEALHRACVLLFTEDPFATPSRNTDTAPKKQQAPAKKKTDVSKNIEAVKRTPPADTGRSAGNVSGKIDVANLSDEEFEKLPASKKRELRGDVV